MKKNFLTIKKITILSLLLIFAILLFGFTNKTNKPLMQNNTPLQSIEDSNLSDIKDDFIIKDAGTSYDESYVVVTEKKEDHLFVWGNNNVNQLGLGDDKDAFYSTPQELVIDGAVRIEKVNIGAGHSFAWVKNQFNNDELYMWGANDTGELGLGSEAEKNYSSPQKLKLPSNRDEIVDVSIGGFGKPDERYDSEGSSAMITFDNVSEEYNLYTWGINYMGNLGLGDQLDNIIYKPTKVTDIDYEKGDSIVKVRQTKDTMLITTKKSDGTEHIYDCGFNDGNHGELGLGDGFNETSYDTLQEITDIPHGEIKDVSSSRHNYSAIINVDGEDELYTWGRNNYGSFGIGDKKEYNKPMKAQLPSGTIAKTKLGYYSNSAIVTDENGVNNLYVWGSNENGSFGLGDSSPEEFLIPYKTDLSKDIGTPVNFYLGKNHSLLETTSDDGYRKIYSSGENSNGQLGIGTTEDHNTFQFVTTDFPKIPNQGSINHDTITNKSVDFDFSNTIELSYLSGVATHYKLNIKSDTKSFDWTSGIIDDTPTTQTVTGFENGTLYNNFVVQPIDIYGAKIGESFEIIDSFETTKNAPTGILSAKINLNTVTNSSFDTIIKIDTEDGTGVGIDTYKIEAYAKVGEDISESLIWTSEDQSDKKVTVTIDNLTTSTEYKEIQFWLIDPNNPSKKLGDVFETGKNVTTTDEKVTKILSATIALSSVKYNSFTFDMEVEPKLEPDKKVQDYYIESLYLKNDGTREVFWTSGVQKTTSLEDVLVDGLEASFSYNQVQFQLLEKDKTTKIGDPYDTNIDVKTKKLKAGSLTDIFTTDITYDSVVVNVTVNGSTNNFLGKDLQKYDLIVRDKNSEKTWTEEYLNTDGLKTISVDGLETETSYDLTVEIKGTEEIEDIPEFTTEKFPFIVGEDSFSVSGITKKSFDFNITITNQKWFEGDFNPNDLHLFSDGKELKIISVNGNNNEGNIFSYKAIGLHPKKIYSNFEVTINGSEAKTSINDAEGNPIIVKTKINMIPIYISIGILIILVLITLVFVFIFIKRKISREIADAPNKYRSNFY